MDIVSVRHKALRAYLESGRTVGLDSRVASRLRNMVAFLVAADNVEELAVPPNFGFHWLAGNRNGIAAMTVTRNWRLTFRLDENNGIVDLDLEDYH
jgi:proteic killer suppression protein